MKTKFFYGMAALATLGLSACSSEEPANNGNGVSDKDQSLYLKVALKDVNNGTRATNNSDNFEDGTDAENTIKALQFKFYDASGTEIYNTNMTDVTLTTPDKDPYPSVGKLAIATIRVNVEQGENMPAYVVCFANPVVWESSEGANPGAAISQMNGLRNVTRNNYLGNNGSYAMNNSVFYGKDPISNTEGVKMVGAPIEKGQLFTTEEAAEKATKGSIVDIYIERYAAKVKVSLAQNAVAPATVGGYSLTFVPERVAITADAQNMYAVKRFSTTNGNEAPIPTLDQVNSMMGTWNGWNDAPLHRSYWSCSPAYYATSFPQVSDDIIDVASAATEGATGAGVVVAPYALKYYSYNQMAENGVAKSKEISAGNTSVLYTLENTMGQDAFKCANPKAAAPSVLLVGQTNLSLGETALPAGTTFYVYNDKIYFETVPAGAAEGAQTIYEKMLADQTILASDAQGTAITSETNLGASQLEVTHPSLAARNTTGLKLSEEFVTLQVTNVAANTLYYKPMGSSTWKALDPNDQDAINYVNRQLAGKLLYANAYTNGKCYYTIPVQHLGLAENTTNSPIVDGVLDWTKVRVGDFGLVRNHVYSININNITGYGSGIYDLDNPIVTPMNSYNYYIRYTLNVLNWRIVPVQNVNLN